MNWLRRCRELFSILINLENRMSILIDAIDRNTASVAALTAAVNALPPPVDETAAASAINTNPDALDALTTKLVPKP